MKKGPAGTLPKAFRVSLGLRGEMIGWDYLVKKGYKILEKNYRTKIGEIDVIAQKGRTLAFIEIKTRAHHRFGRPEEAVHPMKQRQLARLAQWYLKDKKKQDVPACFEVLSITWKGREDPEIRLIENAFSLEEEIR